MSFTHKVTEWFNGYLHSLYEPIDSVELPDWCKLLAFITYSITTIFIFMSMRKLYLDRQDPNKFFLTLRNPLLTIFFMFACFINNIFNLFVYIFPNVLISETQQIIPYLNIFNTLLISIVIYVLYILLFAIIHQYSLLHQINSNNSIHRMFVQLVVTTTSIEPIHQNITRSIFITYNLLLSIVIILFYKLSCIQSIDQYFIMITPQMLLLNVLAFIMYRSLPPNGYIDMFYLRKQWNKIAKFIVIPLNIILILVYIFPVYFNIIHCFGDLYILWLFSMTISIYPINLDLEKQRELLSIQQPERWQDFLCKQESEPVNLLEMPIDDAISYINTNIFTNIGNNNVNQEKLDFFMREFGAPDNNENACVTELLFVTELTQIKQHIMNLIGCASSINQCGLIIPIPNGLPSSNLITELNPKLNVDDIYDILARLYLKYINFYTAKIPICKSIATEKLDVIYDKLTHEFPQSMCLKDPMTPEEIADDAENENNNKISMEEKEEKEKKEKDYDEEEMMMINNNIFMNNNYSDSFIQIFTNNTGEITENNGLETDGINGGSIGGTDGFGLGVGYITTDQLMSLNVEEFANKLFGGNNNNIVIDIEIDNDHHHDIKEEEEEEEKEEELFNNNFDGVLEIERIDNFVNNLGFGVLGNYEFKLENNMPLIPDKELQNIYKLIKTYDEILNDAAIKIQICYDNYRAKRLKIHCQSRYL